MSENCVDSLAALCPLECMKVCQLEVRTHDWSLSWWSTLQLAHRCMYHVSELEHFLLVSQVAFPMELDVYDFCSTELKAKLDGPRSILKDEQDRASAAAKLAKNKAKQTVGSFFDQRSFSRQGSLFQDAPFHL